MGYGVDQSLGEQLGCQGVKYGEISEWITFSEVIQGSDLTGCLYLEDSFGDVNR